MRTRHSYVGNDLGGVASVMLMSVLFVLGPFEGFGAAPLEPDVSMFSATVLLMRTVAAGALPHGPVLYSDSHRDLLMAAFLPKLVRFWSSRCHDASWR